MSGKDLDVRLRVRVTDAGPYSIPIGTYAVNRWQGVNIPEIDLDGASFSLPPEVKWEREPISEAALDVLCSADVPALGYTLTNHGADMGLTVRDLARAYREAREALRAWKFAHDNAERNDPKTCLRYLTAEVKTMACLPDPRADEVGRP